MFYQFRTYVRLPRQILRACKSDEERTRDLANENRFSRALLSFSLSLSLSLEKKKKKNW